MRFRVPAPAPGMPRYPQFDALDAARGASTNRQRAAEQRALLIPVIGALAQDGASQSAIADVLNQMGFRTRQGRSWTRRAVLRLLEGATDRPIFKRGGWRGSC